MFLYTQKLGFIGEIYRHFKMVLTLLVNQFLFEVAIHTLNGK